MFTNPITMIGVAVVVFGWLMLGFGIGSDVSFDGRQVVNLHKIALAENVILLGYVLVVSGILVRGLAFLNPLLSGSHATSNVA